MTKKFLITCTLTCLQISNVGHAIANASRECEKELNDPDTSSLVTQLSTLWKSKKEENHRCSPITKSSKKYEVIDGSYITNLTRDADFRDTLLVTPEDAVETSRLTDSKSNREDLIVTTPNGNQTPIGTVKGFKTLSTSGRNK